MFTFIYPLDIRSDCSHCFIKCNLKRHKLYRIRMAIVYTSVLCTLNSSIYMQIVKVQFSAIRNTFD